MKMKIYSSIFFSVLVILAFSQTRHKLFFKPLGKDQSWTVPAGVTQITVKLWAAGGAGDNYSGTLPQYQNGGGGGFAMANLNVTPGEVLTIIVGSGGETGAGSGAYGGGGAKSCGVGGRGGGRSAIRSATGTELITAGAGGGGDFSPDGIGGNGGGGLQGDPSHWKPQDGGPGTQTEGGAGGVRGEDGLPYGSHAGSQFSGGLAGCQDNGYNGSGGGGYFGGGSGTDIGDGAGGGGSSFIPAGGTTIAATNNVPGNISDPDYKYPVGYGGAKGKPGKCGLIVIIYSNNSPIVYAENELQSANKSTVYPNPANNTVNVSFTAEKSGKYAFEITDISGNTLLRKETNALQGANHIILDISGLFKGVFFINITRPDGIKERIQLSKE